jgi:hypothetical protein
VLFFYLSRAPHEITENIIISGVSAVNPLDTFYDVRERHREVQFFYFGPDTTQNFYAMLINEKSIFVYIHKIIIFLSIKKSFVLPVGT